MRRVAVVLVFAVLQTGVAYCQNLQAECAGDSVRIRFWVTGIEDLASMASLVVVAHSMGVCEPDIVVSPAPVAYPSVGESISADYKILNPGADRAFLYELMAVDAEGQFHMVPGVFSPQWGTVPYHHPCGCGEAVMMRGIAFSWSAFLFDCPDKCWYDTGNYYALEGSGFQYGVLSDFFGYYFYETMLPTGMTLFITRAVPVTDGSECDLVSEEKPTLGGVKSLFR